MAAGVPSSGDRARQSSSRAQSRKADPQFKCPAFDAAHKVCSIHGAENSAENHSVNPRHK